MGRHERKGGASQQLRRQRQRDALRRLPERLSRRHQRPGPARSPAVPGRHPRHNHQTSNGRNPPTMDDQQHPEPDGRPGEGDVVYTTGCWYYRLARALRANSGSGSLARRLDALGPDSREQTLASLGKSAPDDRIAELPNRSASDGGHKAPQATQHAECRGTCGRCCRRWPTSHGERVGPVARGRARPRGRLSSPRRAEQLGWMNSRLYGRFGGPGSPWSQARKRL